MDSHDEITVVESIHQDGSDTDRLDLLYMVYWSTEREGWVAYGWRGSTVGLKEVSCVKPEVWSLLDWNVGPNFSIVPSAICAQCDAPSYDDYLCIRCRDD